jgi:hypothetical protein
MRSSRTPSIAAVALAALLSVASTTVAQDQDPSERPGEPQDLPPYAAIEGELIHGGGLGYTQVINAEPPRELWLDWRNRARLETSDPRLDVEGVLNQNYMGFEPGFSGGSVRTGIGRLANDGGSWAVESIGFNQPGASIVDGAYYALTMTGEGGYEGLSAVLFVLPAGPLAWEVRGVIAPAPLPEPPTSE